MNKKETEQKDLEASNEIEKIIDKNCKLFDMIANKGYDQDITIGLYNQVARELRGIEYKKNKAVVSDKPSDKQIRYAKDLGILNPDSMTKIELSKAIDNKLKAN